MPLPAASTSPDARLFAPPPPTASLRALVVPRLTEAERDLLALHAEGLRNGEIAARLAASEATVRRRLAAIYARLGAADGAEALERAYRLRVLKPRA